MKNRFCQFLVATFIVAIITSTGCNSEDRAYKEAENEKTVSSFESYLKNYPHGKKSEIAREELYTLLKSNGGPDWIVFIKGMTKGETIGDWYGQSDQYIRDFDSGTIDWILPDPIEQKIVLLILNDDGLPKGLKKNMAYIWRGGKEFIFIKEIDGILDHAVLKKQFGLNYFSYGLTRPVSFN